MRRSFQSSLRRGFSPQTPAPSNGLRSSPEFHAALTVSHHAIHGSSRSISIRAHGRWALSPAEEFEGGPRETRDYAEERRREYDHFIDSNSDVRRQSPPRQLRPTWLWLAAAHPKSSDCGPKVYSIVRQSPCPVVAYRRFLNSTGAVLPPAYLSTATKMLGRRAKTTKS
jgi:hypothetical protein